MALIAPSEIQFTKFVGDTPAAGIVYAVMPDGSAKSVLGYDPATSTALIPAKVSASPAATDAPVIAMTAANLSAGTSAQAVVAVATSTVTGYVIASNTTNFVGVHVVAQTNHTLYLSTNATPRMKILATGEVVIGPTDIGGTELVRVATDARFGGKVLMGAATSLREVNVSTVGSRLTFLGNGAGLQMRWAWQPSYGAAAVDVLSLSDTGILSPTTANTGALGSSAARWNALYVTNVRIGAPVAAPGRVDAIQITGDLYTEGVLGMIVSSATAVVVAKTSSDLHLVIDTLNGSTFLYKSLFVGPLGSTTQSTFTVEPALNRVTVGLGYAVGQISLLVNGLVSAQQQIQIDGLSFADRLVPSWTRFKAQDGRDVLSFSTLAQGGQFYVLSDLLTVVTSNNLKQLLTLDNLSSPTQLGLAVDHNGVLKRVMVGGTDSGGSGRRLLTIVN